MANLPKVVLIYSDGNLLQDIESLDGIAGLVGTGSTSGLLGVPKVVYNLDDAVSQGFTEADEPDMYRHLKEFYAELGGSQELHVMIVADTMTMADMLDNTNANGAKKLLNDAQGRVRLLGVFRNPGSGYDGGADFIDADVSDALTNSLVFGQARLAENAPIRMLIEGRVENPSASNTLIPKEAGNGFAGVLLGGTLNDGSASIGLLLGRAVKYSAEIKIGKVANGALSVSKVYIGDKELKDVAALDTLHGNGFISFTTHPQKSGIFFGIDRMATTTDYRLLAYGRVIDKAALIATAVYVEQLEGEVDIDANGNISELDLAALESNIKRQINVSMGTQISSVTVYINPSQNLINTGKLTVKLSITPKGYTSEIDVELGLLAP